MNTPYYRYPINGGRATTIRAAATANDQNRLLDEVGLTLVAYVRPADRYPLLKASAQVQEACKSFYRFKPKTLHITITSILAHRQPKLSDQQRQQIEQAVIEGMTEEMAQTPQFAVAIQGIAPGGSTNRPGGNIVAVAAPASRQEIQGLGTRLLDRLNPQLAKICPGLQAEPANGAKVTLGFFNEKADFRIGHKLALTLEELRHLQTEFWVERVALVRFRSKSLADAKIIHKVDLPKPASPPIRQATRKPKVLLALNWVPWPGITILFNNPGESYLRQPETGLEQIACDPWVDPALSLYRALGDALAEAGIDSPGNAFAFCPLPSPSYHVTAWDGVNHENLSQLVEPERQKFGEFLLGLPGTARRTPPELIPPDAFRGIDGADPVRFRFAGLSIWGDSVLVARLAPADEKSAAILEQIKKRREQLDEQFAPLGRPKPQPEYHPHVSLGYFSHSRGAHAAAAELLQWESVFRRRTAGCSLTFQTISAYGFTSMINFFKLEFAGNANP
jgi:hypothetical protein